MIRNLKFKIKNLKLSRGFTLLELIVVMAILVTVGSIIVAVLFSSLRGGNKTNSEIVLEQNGNFAISQMSKVIRNAKKFDGVSTDGNSFTSHCVSNPSMLYKSIKVDSFDGTTITYSCNDAAKTISATVALGPTITPGFLLDSTNVSVPAGACSFTCSQSTLSDYPLIGITFSLQQANNGALPEQTARQNFSTSILLRNINR